MAGLEAENVREKHDHRRAMGDNDHASARMGAGNLIDCRAHALYHAVRQLFEVELATIAELHLHLNQSMIDVHVVRDDPSRLECPSIWAAVDACGLELAYPLGQEL